MWSIDNIASSSFPNHDDLRDSQTIPTMQEKLRTFICSPTSFFVHQKGLVMLENFTNPSRTFSFPAHAFLAMAFSRVGQINSAVETSSAPSMKDMAFAAARAEVCWITHRG